MKISEELAKELYEISTEVVINGIKALYDYLKNNSYVSSYYIYPEPLFKGIEEKDAYKEMIEMIPAMKCGIMFFHKSHYDNPKNYDSVFSKTDAQFHINCHTLDKFNELLKIFKDNEVLFKRMTSGEDETYIENAVVNFVSNCVNRYLYSSRNFQDSEIDIQKLKEIIIQKINRYYYDNLKIEICTPMCFLNFEEDSIEINEKILISKMSPEFQISRFNTCDYESKDESQVVQCASYMIKLKGYQIENKNKESLKSATKNYWAYPLQIIDDLFASIRIVVGYNTGYGQLLLEPVNWSDEWVADMIPLYGAQIRAFNRKNIEENFNSFNIYKISNEDIVLIREIFDIICKERESKKKNKLFNKAFIAIDRLNRCMLREEDDDTALDAIIGIETLLSGDSHAEITYTISNRISVIAAMLKKCPYTAQEARYSMTKIYGFRSDIVHGRDVSKTNKIKLGEVVKDTKDLAVEFLRYVLMFILKNQEYLKDDEKRYELLLDGAIQNGSKMNTPDN